MRYPSVMYAGFAAFTVKDSTFFFIVDCRGSKTANTHGSAHKVIYLTFLVPFHGVLTQWFCQIPLNTLTRILGDTIQWHNYHHQA